MMHAIRLTLVALLATCLPLAASPAWAASKTCLTGSDPSVASDSTQIPAVRKAIDAACDCASFDGTSGKRHSNYVRCANTVILSEVAASDLRSQCKSTVKGYVSNSTCGTNPKLHDVVCIKTTLSSGKVSCSIQPTTKGDGTTPNDKCASSPGKFDKVACPDFSDCIDAADSNGDLLIAAPGDSGTCNPKFIPAVLRLNELNANLAAGRDRIELVVVHSGNTSGIVVQQDVGSPKILATLPAVDVLAGDLIVIHMNPGASDAPASETTGQAQYPSATYTTNYDTAWDFLGESIGSAGITWADHVILIKTSDGKVQDAVPFVRSALGAPPAAFLADLQSIQASGLWLPADCGGSPCTHTTTPSAESISVEWGGLGSIVTGKSVARISSTDTDTNADWAVGTSTFGAPNP